MKINDTIIETLKDYNIPLQDGVPYLLAIFHGYNPSYIPDILKKKVQTTNIFNNEGNKIDWIIPLFEGTLQEYEWVKEYVAVFKSLNPSVPGSVTESTRRFKTFFAKNPQYTVQDVKGALNLYIKSLSDPKFIGFPHYFINKDGYSLLETWIETYLGEKETAQQRSSKSNTMQ